jgi:hypothetical protein
MWYNDHPPVKTLDERKEIYGKRLTQSLCKIKKEHARTYVVKPVPEMKVHVAHNLARQMMITSDVKDVALPLDEYYTRHDVVLSALKNAKKQCGIQLLDPLPYLCTSGQCKGSVNLRPIYHDDDHLSLSGVKYLTPLFKPFFPN